MKYLGRLPGMVVKRLPDRTERIHWDGLSGPCNVPGVGSHQEITDWADLIFSTSKPTYEDRTRLCVQAKVKPVVIDVDDDVLSIDRSNQAYKAWHANDKVPDKVMELTGLEDKRELDETCKRTGARIVDHLGKKYLWQENMPAAGLVIEEIEAAHLVTVSTERLKEVYSRFNKNVLVVPNAVDPELWPENAKKDDGIVRIGLFGSNTHYSDWREVVDILKDILNEFPNVRLCMNSWYIGKGEAGASLDELEKRYQFADYWEQSGLLDDPTKTELYEPCEIQDWAQWMADKGVDIGLAPLKDTLFNSGKSNLKYIEFSALGIPGVYADLRPYNEDVKHGVTGYLAGKPHEYGVHLRKLIRDVDLRKKIGDAAKADVLDRYHIAKIAENVAEEFKKLTAPKLVGV